MKCISCGSELSEGFRFCTKCGALQIEKKICPKCKMELPPDAKFCLSCGTPQPKFCLYCNSELPPDALFCMQCGTKVRDNFYEGEELLSKDAYKNNLTENPLFLERGTDGTAGTGGSYVLFGDWPQSLKLDNVVINENAKAFINGWECYRGSDCNFYVKEIAEPYDEKYCFDNGKNVVNGNVYYFKMEPIKWRVIDANYCGGKLLLAEKALTVGCFDNHGDYWNDVSINRKKNGKTVFPNNYKYSSIRAYLNGLDGTAYDVENFVGKGFLNMAFSLSAQEKIKCITVDNSDFTIMGSGVSISENWLDEDKNPYKYVCSNTVDRIFLLSEKDITEKNYGFEPFDSCSKDSIRTRKATDYVKAKCNNSDGQEAYEPAEWWWLRSPYFYTSAYAQGVSGDGGADFHVIVCNPNGKIVPALVLNR